MMANYKVWPIAQSFNFFVVPFQFRYTCHFSLSLLFNRPVSDGSLFSYFHWQSAVHKLCRSLLERVLYVEVESFISALRRGSRLLLENQDTPRALSDQAAGAHANSIPVCSAHTCALLKCGRPEDDCAPASCRTENRQPQPAPQSSMSLCEQHSISPCSGWPCVFALEILFFDSFPACCASCLYPVR